MRRKGIPANVGAAGSSINCTGDCCDAAAPLGI
jgi:hypothetical protein